MDKKTELIYNKGNSYRLHTENLRWILLGGYAVFFTTAIQSLQTKTGLGKAGFAFAAFFISILVLLILAIQSWYYNAYADFVKECEDRISKNVDLRTHANFLEEKARFITPFHEAFFFAMIGVVGTSSWFLFTAYKAFISEFQYKLTFTGNFLAILVCFIFLSIIFCCSIRWWNDIIYKRIIKRLNDLLTRPHLKR